MASPLAIVPILLHVLPADVVDADRWLASDSLIVGVNADGSLVNTGLDLGLIWDLDGSDGPVPAGGDLLTPGNQADAWSLSFVAGGTTTTLVNAAAYLGSDVPMTWDGPWESLSMTWLHATGETAQVSVEEWIEIAFDADVVWFTFAVTARTALDDVRMAKVLDPDPDAWSTGAYETANEAGDGWAVAAGSFDDRALAVAATGGTGGICSWCTAPSQIEASPQGPSFADAQIGVAVRLGPLAQGETATVTFAYFLEIGAEQARSYAIEAAASADHDGDGVAEPDDCDPRDPLVNAAEIEQWDGLDNDCDGAIDEDTPGFDDDGDGVTEADGDCDDADSRVHPGAAPIDGVVDANCDGVADDGGTPGADAGPAADSGGGGCGCAAGGHPGGGRHALEITFLLALLAALLRRRGGRAP